MARHFFARVEVSALTQWGTSWSGVSGGCHSLPGTISCGVRCVAVRGVLRLWRLLCFRVRCVPTSTHWLPFVNVQIETKHRSKHDGSRRRRVTGIHVLSRVVQ